jgi:hypothetical protein
MAAKKDQTINITGLMSGEVKLRVLGRTPLIQNRMSQKTRMILLTGGGKKTAAEKKAIKHSPIEEYYNAAEHLRDGPTAVGIRSAAFKNAMCNAALVTEGVAKTHVQKLVFIEDEYCPLYGTPELRMAVVRSADMNRTPDIRSVPIYPKWATEVKIRFIAPHLSAVDVATLLRNAGLAIGVGDGRQEKGKLSFGGFDVFAEEDTPQEWHDIVASSGRDVQTAALQSPEPYDIETGELFKFYEEEVVRRAVAM